MTIFGTNPIEGFVRRVGNPLEWKELDRCLFVVVATLAYEILYTVTGYTLLHTGGLPAYFDAQVMASALKWLGLGGSIVWLVLAIVGFKLRQKSNVNEIYLFVITLLWWGINSFTIYLMGTYTTPFTFLVLLGGGFVGFLLIPRGIVLLGVSWGVLILLVTTIGSQAGWIPYAPLFVASPVESGQLSIWWLVSAGIIPFGFTAFLLVLAYYVMIRWREREEAARALSVTDSLTGLTNRRRFAELLEFECERARRTGKPLALLMCDADHFKQVNDTYGHRTGDDVLRSIGGLLRRAVRTGTDMPARIGGEEFAVLLAETDLKGARHVGDRIVQSAREIAYGSNGTRFRVTLSVGVVSLSGEELDPDVLMEAADTLLYRAKKGGRDQVKSATLGELRSGASA